VNKIITTLSNEEIILIKVVHHKDWRNFVIEFFIWINLLLQILIPIYGKNHFPVGRKKGLWQKGSLPWVFLLTVGKKVFSVSLTFVSRQNTCLTTSVTFPIVYLADGKLGDYHSCASVLLLSQAIHTQHYVRNQLRRHGLIHKGNTEKNMSPRVFWLELMKTRFLPTCISNDTPKRRHRLSKNVSSMAHHRRWVFSDPRLLWPIKKQKKNVLLRCADVRCSSVSWSSTQLSL
jgi:hypothetical protein